MRFLLISKHVKLLLFSTAVAMLGASASTAQPVTVPPSLGDGDSYRLVFLTSTEAFAGSTDVADYNDYVTAVANTVPELVALGTTWKAIASTATDDARDNTRTNPTFLYGHPLYRLDGALVAARNELLWDGTLDVAIDIYEDGTAGGGGVYTGTQSNGRAALGGQTMGDYYCMIGTTSTTGAGWVELGGLGQLAPQHFYAVSDVITVPSVPTPSWVPSVVALLFGASGISWLRRSAAR